MARRREEGVGALILRIVLGGCVMGALLTFAIFFIAAVIVAIKFREAQRHGIGIFAKKDKNDDGDPPLVVRPPVDPPHVNPPQVNPPANMNPLDKVGKDGLMRTHIVGGAFEPEFEDKAPPAGVLIGLELAVVKDEGIKSIRPIYLAQGKEVKGTQVGTEKINTVLKAKNGYAVSALNVNAGLWLNIISLTFARMNNGKLNTNDTYQSPAYGEPGGSPSVHGGNGMNVVGVIGKRAKGDSSACGIGLLLK